VTPDELLPGDVLLTRHEGWMGRLIRFGAALRELITPQPKTPAQREVVVRVARAMLGTPYDWEAIVGDGADALGIDKFWRPADFPDNGRLPLATVCSALWDYAYQRAELANPGANAGGRFTTPADWDTFITTRAWETP
jgi:hypothetical protein